VKPREPGPPPPAPTGRIVGWNRVCAAALAIGASGCARGVKTAPLAPAGSPRDDGSGVIARLSTGAELGRERARADESASSKTADQANEVVADHPSTDGSSPYANYHFDRPPRPHAAPLPYAGRYIPAVPATIGGVEGTVIWAQPPRLAGQPPLAPGEAPRCDAAPPAMTTPAGVAAAHAIVYLEDVRTGRLLLGRMNAAFPNLTKQMQLGGVVEWRACRFHPAVQVVAPIGSVLALTSADDVVQVSAVRVDGRGRERLWSIALGAPGAVHEHLLVREGIIELRVERAGGALAGSGWVVVASHPYFAITDERGHFALEEVPPGAYTLVVWHPPVVVGYTDGGEPITRTVPPVRRRVVVAARQAQRALIRLPSLR
jgi:hypothetical protein